jgi:asparagine synthase (glutamine-hydrolysing)
MADLVPYLVEQFDEPFGDFSIFPTYFVSKLARQTVKVVLSGDGGDEIFAGYDPYVAQNLGRYYRFLPDRLRTKTLPKLAQNLPPQAVKKGLINKMKRYIEGGSLPESLQHTRWMVFLSEIQKASLYTQDLQTVIHGDQVASVFQPYFHKAANQDPLIQQQYVDIKTYLADDILTKVDRMSMAVSLEARVPLLDHRLVEFAVNLPAHRKLDMWRTKKILRQTMKHILPNEVIRKPKQGFSSPIKNWLNGSLRPMMTDLLSESTVRRRGYFEPAIINRWVQEHVQNQENHSHRLWSLMIFELWHQKRLDQGVLT